MHTETVDDPQADDGPKASPLGGPPSLRTFARIEQFDDGAGGWHDVPRVPLIWAAIALRHFGDDDVVRWRDCWWRWGGSHWRETADGEMSAAVRIALARVECRAKNGDDTRAPLLTVDRKVISETLAALSDLVRVPDEVEPFTWRTPQSGDALPADLIVCKNGLFDLRRRKLLPSDRRYMATGTGDWKYSRTDHIEWNRWLRELWPDQASRDHIQEVIGLLISGDRNLQKILALIGRTRSGKSLFLRIVGEILGPAQAVTVSSAAFGETFGLSGTIGKRLVMIADLRLGRQVDRGALAERFLTFSGEDRASIAQKFRGDWSGTPTARLVYAANEPLTIADDSSALPNRTVPVVFERSWLGREDPTLINRFRDELPGIVEWAAVGLARLRERGRFTLPPAAERMLSDMVGDASPITQFVADQCVREPEARIETDELWREWRTWAEAAGERPGTQTSFGRALRAAFPEIVNGRSKGGRSERRSRSYVGIRLRWKDDTVSRRVHAL